MNSVKHASAFEIKQPIEKVFPLLSPEGEKLWVPDWDYENLMGKTDLFEDYIFLTKTHDHASTDAIWLVKRYEPETYHVQFYKVEPEDKVGIITVRCIKEGNEFTQVQVTYEYIALTSRGSKFIEGFTREEYGKYIAEWERLMKEYFTEQQKNGKMN